MHPSRLPVFDRASEITSLVMMFTLDDIIDTYLLGKSHLSTALKDMLDITLNTLKGNAHPPKLPPFHFPAYNDFMRCVLNERRVISQNGWDANNYIKEFDRLLWQTVPPSHRDTYRNIIPTVKRYLQIEKITTTFSYYLERSCQTEGISMKNFRGLPAFKRYISCAEKAHRILVDIPSILNDTATLDNYCLRVQHEFKLTIGEAVARAARKANKEMTKMQVLKKTLREDSGLSGQHDLEHCFWLAECFIDGGFAWAMNTQRYKSEWTCYHADVKLDSSIENVLQDILL
ncbi:unnamed protein product [Bemisia tabaci]|uniref:Uncharacterized protein n=1 Tax=Bemisia tabaci TaxID=7038 RepID=A0A9P0A2X7_BEMTA|nr:unnamed protein product [Bemisia tabaci]